MPRHHRLDPVFKRGWRKAGAQNVMSKLGVDTVCSLLRFFPRTYMDFPKPWSDYGM